MKFVFLDNCLDKRKCGAAAGAAAGAAGGPVGLLGAAGISAVGGLAQGLVTSSSSNKIANKQIAAQQRENQLNRDWQTEQAEVARQYNTSERVAQQDFQQAMMEYQNQWNSPQHQVAMLRDAGLNPNIALSGSGTTMSASPSGGSAPSSPMPSGVGGISPVSQQPLDLQIPQMANAVASMLTGIADAKKAGVETDFLQKSLFDRLRSVKADADSKEIGAILLDLDKYVKENVKDTSIQKAWFESEKAVYDAIISFNSVGKVKNESEYYAALTDLQKAFKNETDAKTQLIGLEVTSFIPKLDAYLKLTRAQTSESLAGAEAKASQVGLNRSLSELMDIKRDIEHTNWSENKFSLFGRVSKVYAELKHQGLLNKQLQNEVDNQLGKQFLDGAEQGVNIVSKLIGTVTSVLK